MCLLPAAIVFVGMSAIFAADEFRTGKEMSPNAVGLVCGLTFIFMFLGIIFR
jgi:hypothetical protein